MWIFTEVDKTSPEKLVLWWQFVFYPIIRCLLKYVRPCFRFGVLEKKFFKKSKFWNCFYMTTSEIRENFWTFDFHKLNKIIEFQFWDFTLKKFHFPKIWEKNWIPNGTDLIFENLETLLNCIFSTKMINFKSKSFNFHTLVQPKIGFNESFLT